MKYLVFVVLVSCSLAKVEIKSDDLLPYKESSQVTQLNSKLKPVRIDRVEDKRQEQSYGFAYTGVQYVKSPVQMEVPLDILIRDLTTEAFEKRNLVIDNRPESLSMEIEVNKMWVEEVIEEFQPEKARCKVDMAFHINTNDSKWSGQYWTEFTSAGDLSDGTTRLAPTLASCYNELIEKLVNDKKFQEILK